MRAQKVTLWGEERLTLERSIALTVESLQRYSFQYKHWAIAYSGGKDSTATVTLIAYLISTGQIQAPESLTILYADTRMEVPPLQMAAIETMKNLKEQGNHILVVLPELDRRFFVYLFGYGVPAPKNHFRWCTQHLKVDPMEQALEQHAVSLGLGEMVWNARYQKMMYHSYGQEKLLLLTGMRVGESAARDQRIALSCSRDGGECGQGWFQEKTPSAIADVLAPLIHWRVCNVWDFLTFHAPRYGFPTELIAEVYGGEEKDENNARTGCVGCNLVQEDMMLDRVITLPHWTYLAPLKRLRPLYQKLLQAQYRLRQDGTQRLKNGAFPANPMRLGPMTMEARQYGLSVVLDIQNEINEMAQAAKRPSIDLINAEEQARILWHIEHNTWPKGWTGNEVRGDVSLPRVIADGIIQPSLY